MFRRRNWNVKIKMEERFSEIESIFQDFLMHDLFDVTQNWTKPGLATSILVTDFEGKMCWW